MGKEDVGIMMPQSQIGIVLGHDISIALWVLAAIIILGIILSTHKKGGD